MNINEGLKMKSESTLNIPLNKVGGGRHQERRISGSPSTIFFFFFKKKKDLGVDKVTSQQTLLSFVTTDALDWSFTHQGLSRQNAVTYKHKLLILIVGRTRLLFDVGFKLCLVISRLCYKCNDLDSH